MKRFAKFTTALTFVGLTGCAPNLVVREVAIDFTEKTVRVSVENVGNMNAGQHLTYIEINAVTAPASAKPQSQYSARVNGIAAGATWDSGAIPFSSFSSPRGLDLTALTTANVVIRADAKNMVKESNENDNLSDANY
jgi:hypothetical protein